MATQPSNFLHSIVTSISRSSSKMSRVPSEISNFFSIKNEVPRIFPKIIDFDVVFHADSDSELSLVRISFQTWDIQHRTFKNDHFRHPTRLLGSFTLPHRRQSPHEIASFCRVFHGLQTGTSTNADHYILKWKHQRLSRQTDFFNYFLKYT